VQHSVIAQAKVLDFGLAGRFAYQESGSRRAEGRGYCTSLVTRRGKGRQFARVNVVDAPASSRAAITCGPSLVFHPRPLFNALRYLIPSARNNSFRLRQ
jgi:hypothetical protein